ncbi:hypothetical protein MMC12_001879 [Toensbergia leucococca]|nr:hypothetical protein [Toensbergia leucococca]
MYLKAGTRLVHYSRPLACGNSKWGAHSIRWASSPARHWSTPLAKNIAEAIASTGPISIAAYMRQCLTSPDNGYYTSRTSGPDQFGQKGDFTTSPEISQIFGELLGIWLVAEWMAQGKISSGVDIIEVGPGRGTLMDDMLRTIQTFKPLASSIESIYLVEASPSLRETQKELLCGADVPVEEIDIGFRSKSRYSGLPIIWCEDIRFVPNNPSQTPFIVAHEFFDALPIHAFQSITPALHQSPTLTTPTGPITLSSAVQNPQTPQWRELVITPTPLANTTTFPPPKTPPPDFQLSLSNSPTPSSLLLPETSPRYKALKSHPDSIIEISPESHSYVASFAARIGGTPQTPKASPSGAALILDYGPASTIPTSTLRGIRSHALVSPFSSPGLVDISADVDFTALAEAALAASPGVEVHGPVEQGSWLSEMGVRERGEMICRGIDGGEEGRRRIMGGVERLVERGGGGMGRLYKLLAIVPDGGGRRKPVGFGGGVAG